MCLCENGKSSATSFDLSLHDVTISTPSDSYSLATSGPLSSIAGAEAYSTIVVESTDHSASVRQTPSRCQTKYFLINVMKNESF